METQIWQHKIYPLITWQHNKALLLKSDAHFKKMVEMVPVSPPKSKSFWQFTGSY